jgi:hypothetical protein
MAPDPLTDSDWDDLYDECEYGLFGTDPYKEDSDNDGIPDGDEDHDGDGLTNREEQQDNPDCLDIDGGAGNDAGIK